LREINNVHVYDLYYRVFHYMIRILFLTHTKSSRRCSSNIEIGVDDI